MFHIICFSGVEIRGVAMLKLSMCSIHIHFIHNYGTGVYAANTSMYIGSTSGALWGSGA